MLRKSSWRALVALVVLGVAGACSRDPEVAKREFLERGDRYLADKKYGEAIVEYRNALEQDPRFGEALHRLGKAFALSNSPDNALRQLVRAADLLPNDPIVQLDAAKALLLASRFEDARARAERVIELSPRDVDAHIVRASAMAGLRDFESAIATVEEAIELNPGRSASYLDLGMLRLGAGQRDQAEKAFKEAIALGPESVPAHVALASYYWAVGRAADAEDVLLRVLKLAPNDPVANRALASLYVGTGRPDRAEAPLRSAVGGSDDLQARLVLADYYIGQRRPEDARPLLEDLATHKEAFAAARVRLAGIEYEAGRQAQAHAMVDEVLAREPNNAQVMVVKAGWLLGEQKVDDAFSRAQAAVKANPALADAHLLLASIQVERRNFEAAIQSFNQVLQLNPRAVAAQLELARINLAFGRGDQAVQFADAAVRNLPTSGAARLMLAKSLLAAGYIDRAQAELAPVAAVAADSAEVHTVRGQIEHRRGVRQAARRSYERALQLDAGAVEALTGLIRLDVGDKQIARAQRRVDDHLAKAQESTPLLMLAAQTHATGGDLAKAEALLRRTIELDSAAFDAYRVLGQLYIQQNKLEAARQEFEQITRKRPDDIAAHTMNAMILQVQGRIAEARASYQRILDLSPRAAVAANNLAYMHAEDGTNLDLALNLAQAAVAELPEDPDVNDTLGWIYVKRNLPALAVDALQRSVAKNPSNALYQYHLGVAYLQAGDTAKARAALERALQLEPAFAEADAARRALASIRG